MISRFPDFFEKYINEKREVIYRFRPYIGDYINPFFYYYAKGDPEVDKVKTIEIADSINYLDSNAACDFPNLQKIIVKPNTRPLAFGDEAFKGCPSLLTVELYRPICFVNRDSRHWIKPFNDSKNVVFLYHIDITESYNEIKRWNIPYKDLTKQAEKPVTPNRGLSRMKLFR